MIGKPPAIREPVSGVWPTNQNWQNWAIYTILQREAAALIGGQANHQPAEASTPPESSDDDEEPPTATPRLPGKPG